MKTDYRKDFWAVALLSEASLGVQYIDGNRSTIPPKIPHLLNAINLAMPS